MSTTRAMPFSAPMPRPKLPWYRRAALAMVRAELPGWGRCYAAIGGECDPVWREAGLVRMRGKLHGYEVELDLGNWSERLSWFLGRYHDLPIQRALQCVLRPGDAFVDIGANLGHLTLLARALVGARGAVLACEPNPRLMARLRRTLAANGLDDVMLAPVACSDADGTAQLYEFAGHSGWGSLVGVGPDGSAPTARWTVACRPGDAVVSVLPDAAPLAIKIDVEGYEVPAVRGLARTLATRRPLVFIEVVDAHQRRAGQSAQALLAEFARHGYRGYALADRRRFGLWHDVRIAPLAADGPCASDAVFVPPSGVWAARLAGLLPR